MLWFRPRVTCSMRSEAEFSAAAIATCVCCARSDEATRAVLQRGQFLLQPADALDRLGQLVADGSAAMTISRMSPIAPKFFFSCSTRWSRSLASVVSWCLLPLSQAMRYCLP